MNTKIILFSVGVTGKYSWFNKKIISQSLKDINKVYVRDGQSLQNLKNIFNVEAKEIPDVVFSIKLNGNIEEQSNTALFGITGYDRIKKHNGNYSGQAEYFEEMYKKILDIEKQYKVKLIYSNREDYIACRMFAGFVEENYNRKLQIADYTNFTEFISLIGKAELIISPRMHALILGMMMNKEIEPEMISPKINSFRNKYLLQETNIEELEKQLDDAVGEIIEEFI